MKKIFALLLLGFCLAGFTKAEDDAIVEVDAAAVQDDGDNSDARLSVAKFKDELAPSGKWVEDATYGWVWVPAEAVADADWCPYVQGGHWTYTDAGWYWASDYGWGSVCFHYGRWYRHPAHGWCWVAGSQWAPAWVCWRECDTHYAWAPLPPCSHFSAGVGFFFHGKHCGAGFEFGLGVSDFCFVPCGAFLEVNLWKHHCHHDECVKIYNKTVIHNTYVYRNKTIQNHCFRKEVVEERTHRKIESRSIEKAEIQRSHKIAHEARAERNAHANHGAIKETREGRKDAHVPNKVERQHPTHEQREAQMQHNREANREAIRETHEARKDGHVIRHEQHAAPHAPPQGRHH